MAGMVLSAGTVSFRLLRHTAENRHNWDEREGSEMWAMKKRVRVMFRDINDPMKKSVILRSKPSQLSGARD